MQSNLQKLTAHTILRRVPKMAPWLRKCSKYLVTHYLCLKNCMDSNKNKIYGEVGLEVLSLPGSQIKARKAKRDQVGAVD
jgi:hypothetical protein